MSAGVGCRCKVWLYFNTGGIFLGLNSIIHCSLVVDDFVDITSARYIVVKSLSYQFTEARLNPTSVMLQKSLVGMESMYFCYLMHCRWQKNPGYF